jgi:hypothetical protein
MEIEEKIEEKKLYINFDNEKIEQILKKQLNLKE